MTSPLSTLNILDLPLEVLSRVAAYHADPSTFSVCCQKFYEASEDSFRELAEKLTQIDILEQFKRRSIEQITVSTQDAESFKGTVKKIYINVMQQTLSCVEGNEIIRRTKKAYKKTLDPARLQEIARWIEAQELINFFDMLVTRRSRIVVDSFARIFGPIVRMHMDVFLKAEMLRDHLKIPENQEVIDKIYIINLNESYLYSLPPEIAYFRNLDRLYLAHNQLQSLPPEIGCLSKLTHLDVAYNQLKAFPPQIGNLTQLKSINAWKNQLQVLPLEIGNLHHLERLDVSNNPLQTLPPEIRQLTQLEIHLTKDNQNQILFPEISYFP